MEKYFDKNGNEIKKGMYLKHDDGEISKVYASDDGDLGFNATNENWKGWDGFTREIYPLYQFRMREWEIVDAN